MSMTSGDDTRHLAESVGRGCRAQAPPSSRVMSPSLTSKAMATGTTLQRKEKLPFRGFSHMYCKNAHWFGFRGCS